jgi:hypothetical protein
MRAQVPTEQLGDCRTGTTSSSAPCQTYSSVHTRQSRQAMAPRGTCTKDESTQQAPLYGTSQQAPLSTNDTEEIQHRKLAALSVH